VNQDIDADTGRTYINSSISTSKYEFPIKHKDQLTSKHQGESLIKYKHADLKPLIRNHAPPTTTHSKLSTLKQESKMCIMAFAECPRCKNPSGEAVVVTCPEVLNNQACRGGHFMKGSVTNLHPWCEGHRPQQQPQPQPGQQGQGQHHNQQQQHHNNNNNGAQH